jgi:uncharacterized membrane protein
VRPLRLAALALGAVILLRLLLNPAIIDYPIGATPLFNGLLYLYGIPCAAFVLAAAWFRRGGEHPVVSVLEGGAIALGLALVSLEIRHLFTGGRLQGPYTIAEGALHADAWLAFGYALMRQAGRSKRPVQEFAWQIVAAVAGAHVAIVECLALNPLISPTPLGATPIFDVLLLAYAVPAVFAALYELALRRRGLERPARVAGIASLALGFLYISLEVRHLFHGSRIDGGGATDGEWYAYSVAWLAYGAVLLALGIMRHEARLRAAGLAIGALVAVKAFGFDMAALTGLYRATSFLGLGASLIAIAWLYQRMGGRADAPSDVVPDRGA